jgi:acyl dehydratase
MPTTMTLRELEQSGERDLGTSPWRTIDQQRIDLFADATDDHQWIHCDPEAAALGPFGATIVPGYLTLSLVSAMFSETVSISDARIGVNYGTEKTRFVAPVRVGSRIRLHARLLRAARRQLGVVFNVGVQVEIEGNDKPALVGEVVFLASGGPGA